MALSPGTRFGAYEVLSPLGEGGMGEVYRGRDANLGRDVAIKVLTSALANDGEYIARFQREAHVLASLNHPNIAAIYGLEGPAIVMELVEGPSLADRIAQGPMPIQEALLIARQIAEALEYAHDRNIIHRDLKPANVKITPEGVVKILDFGLAKIAEAPASQQSNLAMSPTLTVRAATQVGVILGTAAYMAPEQARGQAADRRADIWSFGVVLFEMLAGKMAFQGDNVTDVLASVVKLDPEWSQLPASTPPGILKLIQRCITKDRKRRLQAIGDARLFEEEFSSPAAPAAPFPLPQHKPWAWIALACSSLIALAGLSFIHYRETSPPPVVAQYTIEPPPKSLVHTFAVSPDGRYLVIAAAIEAKRRLYLRPLGSLEFRELRDTEEAAYPFWSPDSRSIGFFTFGKLKRIDVDGSPTQILCDAQNGRGGTWNRDGLILFASSSAGLKRVAAIGGAPTTLTKAADGEFQRFPAFLPDGKRFLYLSSGRGKDEVGLMLASLDGQPTRRILADDSSAMWMPPIGGGKLAHLLFRRNGTLMAYPFDADSDNQRASCFLLPSTSGKSTAITPIHPFRSTVCSLTRWVIQSRATAG